MNSYTPMRRMKPPESLSNYWSEENQSMERLAQLQTPEAMNTALFSALKRKDLLCNVISRHLLTAWPHPVSVPVCRTWSEN